MKKTEAVKPPKNKPLTLDEAKGRAAVLETERIYLLGCAQRTKETWKKEQEKLDRQASLAKIAADHGRNVLYSLQIEILRLSGIMSARGKWELRSGRPGAGHRDEYVLMAPDEGTRGILCELRSLGLPSGPSLVAQSPGKFLGIPGSDHVVIDLFPWGANLRIDEGILSASMPGDNLADFVEKWGLKISKNLDLDTAGNERQESDILRHTLARRKALARLHDEIFRRSRS